VQEGSESLSTAKGLVLSELFVQDKNFPGVAVLKVPLQQDFQCLRCPALSSIPLPSCLCCSSWSTLSS